MSEPRPGLETEPVPDGSLAPPARPIAPRASTPDNTQHVPDLPRFGRFQATAELGAGAMGTVYRAHDDVLGRTVAIKTLRAGNDAGVRERFLQEARAIGAVHHPNILGIYDAGTEGDTPYLVMELASGGSLRERIRSGPLAVDAVRKIGIQIARALAAAHAAKILHRDVKPANILCTQDGAWKLADFGIARLPDSSLTITGQFLGSPSYAAPESLRAGEFSPASDVYGLGATLYEALSGTPPYGAHDVQSLFRKLEQEPPPLRERVAVPGPLGDAIMATLSRDPSKRPSTEQLAHMLAAPGDAVELPAAGDAVGLPAAVGRSRTRGLVVAAILAAALLILILAMRGRSSRPGEGMISPSNTLVPVPAAETTGSNAASEQNAATDQDPVQPTVVDENGNPVDEETARRILDQIERDDRDDDRGPSRGRGHHKHKDREP